MGSSGEEQDDRVQLSRLLQQSSSPASDESGGEDVLMSEGAELDGVDESAVGRLIR